jgi:hypothetical protein
MKKAMEEYKITSPEQQQRLVARRPTIPCRRDDQSAPQRESSYKLEGTRLKIAESPEAYNTAAKTNRSLWLNQATCARKCFKM